MTQIIEPLASPASQPSCGEHRPARRPRRQWPHRLVPVLLILLGALVVAYPVGATFYNNYRQTEFARGYSAAVQHAQPATLRDELARAARYNATLTPGLLRDPWAGRFGGAPGRDVMMVPEYREYLAQLDSFDSMARIRVPEINVDLPIFHGTSDQTLARGVGHFFGSALPVGGANTHAVLTAHSSLAEATLFDRLPELAVGDTLYIDVYGRTLAYQVDKVTVVLPDQLDDLAVVTGGDHVTLVTCTPYAVNSHRLLVRAVRVPFQESAEVTNGQPWMDWTIQSWMLPRLIGAGLAVLVVVAMIVGWLRGDRARRRRAQARAAC